ncbi:MAG: hypothetical protein E7057_09855 [Lentisphaerae bacterium]|nr:hypothetical protein [Lentisphaerota bacterium]
MEMLAKYIRMRTARSAATASHPCVEHATEGINQYREQSFLQKKPRWKVFLRGCQVFFCKLLFFRKKKNQSSLQSLRLMNFLESSSQPSAVMIQPRSQRRP